MKGSGLEARLLSTSNGTLDSVVERRIELNRIEAPFASDSIALDWMQCYFACLLLYHLTMKHTGGPSAAISQRESFNGQLALNHTKEYLEASVCCSRPICSSRAEAPEFGRGSARLSSIR